MEQYEREYCELATQIAKLKDVILTIGGEARRAKLSEAKGQIADAEKLLKRMELEVRMSSAGAPVRQQQLRKVKDYEADLTNLKGEIEKASASLPGGDAARAELGLGSDFTDSSAGQRQRLLDTTERLNKQGDRIKEGRQQLQQAEELGVGILGSLHSQRETMYRVRSHLHEVDDHLARGRRVLTVMGRRALTNKAIMGVIIAALLGAIFLIVYFKVKK